MKDIGIIFSGPMVRALIAGDKTMTRRLAWRFVGAAYSGDEDLVKKPSPWQNVKPGDRLWVRENFIHSTGVGGYAAGVDPNKNPDGATIDTIFQADDGPNERSAGPWTPSIHMPRCLSRLTLFVTATKMQKLQAITQADAIAEGATMKPNCHGFGDRYNGWSMNWREPAREHSLSDARSAFASFICELHDGPRWNLKATNIWDQNPVVVALSFTVHKLNIDAIPAGLQ